jgi:hypothetical protein
LFQSYWVIGCGAYSNQLYTSPSSRHTATVDDLIKAAIE